MGPELMGRGLIVFVLPEYKFLPLFVVKPLRTKDRIKGESNASINGVRHHLLLKIRDRELFA
jgi:hypothetical protein